MGKVPTICCLGSQDLCPGLPGVSRPRGYKRLTWDICRRVFGSLDKEKEGLKRLPHHDE